MAWEQVEWLHLLLHFVTRLEMRYCKDFKIGSTVISETSPCFVVAEIGINHNGDMSLAKEMIDAAQEAGADSVKFQNYHVQDFLRDKSLTYSYIFQGKPVTESMWEMFKRYELTETQLVELKEYCDQKNILFHSTPTGSESLKALLDMKVAVLKNGSDFLGHLPLIREFGMSGLPTVLSTGMATLKEIAEACQVFYETGNRQLILLHCTSSYPAPAESMNLRRLTTLKESFGCLVGFSDHSEGSTAALGAVAMGSVWVEKHFTIDKNLPGPDHRFSSNKEEFKALVKQLRLLEKQKGTPEIQPTEDEKSSRQSFRLSCVASRDFSEGHILSEKDIVFCRPGNGIAPKNKSYLMGARLRISVKEGDLITSDILE